MQFGHLLWSATKLHRLCLCFTSSFVLLVPEQNVGHPLLAQYHPAAGKHLYMYCHFLWPLLMSQWKLLWAHPTDVWTTRTILPLLGQFQQARTTALLICLWPINICSTIQSAGCKRYLISGKAVPSDATCNCMAERSWSFSTSAILCRISVSQTSFEPWEDKDQLSPQKESLFTLDLPSC